MTPDVRETSAAQPPPKLPKGQVLVLFGATGDLAKRKLLPALFHLFVAEMMPARYRIVGSGYQTEITDSEGFRAYVHDVLKQFGRRELTGERWRRFAERLSFAPASADDSEALLQAVHDAERELEADARRLIYLAVPPQAFQSMVAMLGKTGLAERARVIVEKPFGSDLASARELNRTLHTALDEEQIFRIDHFLGKEAVQNILAFRFANGLFEPAWNREHVDYVQIDVPERLTIEGRSRFFEQTGTFRDMIVTHLIHVLGFVAMEPPARLDAQSLREASCAVFDALKPLDPGRAIFGQYDGYRSEPGVAPDSRVETFVALEARIDNPRWAGVPFTLRTGKAMAQSRRTVTLGFKKPSGDLFDLLQAASAERAHSNELTFDLSEPGGIWIDFLAKQPGATLSLGAASLEFEYGDSFDVANELLGYERLLHDCMLGDRTLFTRADGIEHIWERSAPLLEDPPETLPYARQSWGPAGIDQLVAPHRWHLPYPGV